MECSDSSELEQVAQWLDSLYIRLQGAELMFATQTGNETYCESLRTDIERAVQIGVSADRPMEHCGCLFEALNGDEVPREFLLRARSEVNILTVYVRQLANELATDNATSEPAASIQLNDEASRLLAAMMQFPVNVRVSYQELFESDETAFRGDISRDSLATRLKRLKPKLPRETYDYKVHETGSYGFTWLKKPKS